MKVMVVVSLGMCGAVEASDRDYLVLVAEGGA